MIADAAGNGLDVTQLGVSGIMVVAFGIAIRVLWSRLTWAETQWHAEVAQLRNEAREDQKIVLPALVRADETLLAAITAIERTQVSATRSQAPRRGGN